MKIRGCKIKGMNMKKQRAYKPSENREEVKMKISRIEK